MVKAVPIGIMWSEIMGNVKENVNVKHKRHHKLIKKQIGTVTTNDREICKQHLTRGKN